MKQQDLKALSAAAVKRAVEARKTAGVELSAEQVDSVSGGFYNNMVMRIDPRWLGIWEDLRFGKALDLAKPIVEIGPDAKLEAGIAEGKIAF